MLRYKKYWIVLCILVFLVLIAFCFRDVIAGWINETFYGHDCWVSNPLKSLA